MTLSKETSEKNNSDSKNNTNKKSTAVVPEGKHSIFEGVMVIWGARPAGGVRGSRFGEGLGRAAIERAIELESEREREYHAARRYHSGGWRRRDLLVPQRKREHGGCVAGRAQLLLL